jgi:hypothetical protein
MSERMGSSPDEDFTLEEGLKVLLSHRPGPAFVERLEDRLLAEHGSRGGVKAKRRVSAVDRLRRLGPGIVPTAPRLRWAAVTLAALALLLVSLLVIGPERAWAGLQAWLGYVPGVGFVDPAENRLLAGPQSVTRDGVTLQVNQVVAGPTETVVLIDSRGLPPEAELWPSGRPDSERPQAWLHLPGGERLAAKGWTAGLGHAGLLFPPLPPDVYRVTFELSALPLVPAGAAPENWSIPLVLQPARGDNLREAYAPPDAAATQAGVTLSILTVAHSSDGTAVRLRAHWNEPGRDFNWSFWSGEPVLRDEHGNVYRRTWGAGPVNPTVARIDPLATPWPPPGGYTAETTLLFEPVPPGVNRLTLAVEAVAFVQKAEGELRLDLGPAAAVGQSWPLDTTWNVAGYPVHIRAVRLDYGHMAVLPYRLRFETEVEQLHDTELLAGLLLTARDLPFDRQGSSSGDYAREGVLAPDLLLPDIPNQAFTVAAESATLLIPGPWTITWPRPHP